MSTMNIKVPDSLLKQAQEMAEKENMTLEQLVSSALAEKMAAWMTVEYLEKRAARGSQQKFERAMDKVPDAAPDVLDQID
jgi:predicted transcriptional regulator